MSVIRITYSTMGQSSPATVSDDADDAGNPYRWRKTPGWNPSAPGYRPGQAEQTAEPHPANVRAAAKRAENLAECAGYLAQGLTPKQIAKLMGIALSTARQYAREIGDQQQGESRDG